MTTLSKSNYKELFNCVCCGSKNLQQVIDLKDQPLANSFHNNLVKPDKYPLQLNLCTNCWHTQLSIAVNPELMFKDYCYVSGTSDTLRAFFADFAQKALRAFPNTKSVLDIACNDGSQLEAFRNVNSNLELFGVDPAQNLQSFTQEKNIPTLCDFWNVKNAAKLGRKFDLIIMQNVFAHTVDPGELLRACEIVSHKDTKIFIQTSQKNMIANGEFDTIYHEHISFFNINSMIALCNRLQAEGSTDFNLYDVSSVPVHGTSYVFVLEKGGGVKKPNYGQRNDMHLRTEKHLYTMTAYKEFASKTHVTLDWIRNLMSKEVTNGEVIGYGAAAKANTLLNAANIKLQAIVDENPLKIGKFTPGMNIPVVSGEYLFKLKEGSWIMPLAWNFHDEIVRKVLKIVGKPTVFVRYFPKREIKEMTPS